jgi:hypothetical protein
MEKVPTSNWKARRPNDLGDRSAPADNHAVPQRCVDSAMVAIRAHVMEQLPPNIRTQAKTCEYECHD